MFWFEKQKESRPQVLLNILFSDKTGTITKGEMEVVQFFSGDGTIIDTKQINNYPDIREKLHVAIGKILLPCLMNIIVSSVEMLQIRH